MAEEPSASPWFVRAAWAGAAPALWLIGPARHSQGAASGLLALAHIAVGTLALLLAPAALRRIRRAGSADARPGVRTRIAGGLLLLCGAPALWLMARAANGLTSAPGNRALALHIALGSAALLLTLRAPRMSLPRLQAPLMGLGAALLLIGAAASAEYQPAEYYRDLTATNARQARSRLFPAGTRLGEGSARPDADTWRSSAYCGQAGCHPDAHREWLGSAHAQSASDPVYAGALAAYTRRSGADAGRWCAGCHAPGSLFAGAQARGVDCVACHAISAAARTGNGRAELTLPDSPLFAGASGWRGSVHDFLLRVRPAPHRFAWSHPALSASGDACAACHRQSMGVAQNGYQFVRGPDPYGEWRESAFSCKLLRNPDLLSERRQTCVECHFPRALTGHLSHRSPGANIALASLAPDSGQSSAIRSFLMDGRIIIDWFAMRRSGRRSLLPERSAVAVPLRPGEPVDLDLVVTNRACGHGFPSGYLDLQEAWIEVTIEDAEGHVLLRSGPGPGGAPPYRRYGAEAVDAAGAAIKDHDFTRQATQLFRRTISPGGSDLARYRFVVPASPHRLTARARLLYRPWPSNTAGSIAPLMIAEMSVQLDRPTSPGTNSTPSALAERCIRYGVAVLGSSENPDIANALQAFRQASELSPSRPEPHIGQGRAFLTEPALIAARGAFEAALRAEPGNREAQAEMGAVLSRQGEYDVALALLRPLAARNPEDRQLQFETGLACFRTGDYATAAASFQRALDVDPDDAASHFQLRLCYQHLQRIADARREESIGRYLAEDKLRARLLPAYMAAHPEARGELISVPMYTLYPPTRSDKAAPRKKGSARSLWRHDAYAGLAAAGAREAGRIRMKGSSTSR